MREIRLVPERVHGDGTDRIPNSVDPFRQVAEGLRARHVEDRQDALGAVEVRLLEQVEERPLAHDVQDHHVDLNWPALHRTEGDRLLRYDRTEGPNVRLVERAGHEPMDEARPADAFLADEADLELEGLRLWVHRRPAHHGHPPSPARGLSTRWPEI